MTTETTINKSGVDEYSKRIEKEKEFLKILGIGPRKITSPDNSHPLDSLSNDDIDDMLEIARTSKGRYTPKQLKIITELNEKYLREKFFQFPKVNKIFYLS